MLEFGLSLIVPGIAKALLSPEQRLAREKAKAIKEQAKYERDIAETNADLARMSADDAIAEGSRQASAIEAQKRKIRGAQRASYGALGVDSGSGSAGEVGAETEFLAKLDMITAENNAMRAAWGFRMEALQFEKQGIYGQQAADKQAKATLLGGQLDFRNSLLDNTMRSFEKIGTGWLSAGGTGDISTEDEKLERLAKRVKKSKWGGGGLTIGRY